MIEADLAHLRLLRGISRKGDILTQEDVDFVMKMEDQIQMYQNMICEIMSNRCEKEKNL
jgi:hypothetical protein